MSSTARYSSYSCRSGLPQYSLLRSVSIRSSLISCSSNKGTTRSVSRSAAVMGGLANIQLDSRYLGVCFDEGLLIDVAYALEITDVEGILRPAIAWMFALKLTMRLLFGLGLLQGRHLRFGQDQSLLRDLGLLGLQALLHGLQIMPLPDTTHPRRGNA
jgi:hypothetical protein